MSDFSPDFAMLSSEFSSAPLSTTVAILTIIAFLSRPLYKAINGIFKYKKGHSIVLKTAGVPPFVLNFFAIAIPLKKLPSVGYPEKLITVLFAIIFSWSLWYSVPALIQIFNAPPDSALLIWKKSGDRFYVSKTTAMEATVFSSPKWTLSVQDCKTNNALANNASDRLGREYHHDLCRLLTTSEGKDYLDESIKKFKKERMLIYPVIFIIELMLLWLLSGFILTIHYTNKVRHFILLEQKKAIHCVLGDFTATGCYAIYQELENRGNR